MVKIDSVLGSVDLWLFIWYISIYFIIILPLFNRSYSYFSSINLFIFTVLRLNAQCRLIKVISVGLKNEPTNYRTLFLAGLLSKLSIFGIIKFILCTYYLSSRFLSSILS